MKSHHKKLSWMKVSGFTLIEVVIALAVISISMAAVINGVGKNISNASYLREKTLAQWVASNKITEIQLSDAALDDSDTNGESELAGRSWEWNITVSDTDVEVIKRVVVEVGPEDSEETLASVTAFIGSN